MTQGTEPMEPDNSYNSFLADATLLLILHRLKDRTYQASLLETAILPVVDDPEMRSREENVSPMSYLAVTQFALKRIMEHITGWPEENLIPGRAIPLEQAKKVRTDSPVELRRLALIALNAQWITNEEYWELYKSCNVSLKTHEEVCDGAAHQQIDRIRESYPEYETQRVSDDELF